MTLPDKYVKDLVSNLRDSRFEVESNVKNNLKGEGLKGFRWRVDVTISTESLGKVFKPCILGECYMRNLCIAITHPHTRPRSTQNKTHARS